MRKLLSFLFALAVTRKHLVNGASQLFVVLLAMWCGPAWAVVALDHCEASPYNLASSPDNNFTVNNSGSVLVWLVSQANSVGTPSATWNGVSLSAISGATNTNGTVRTDAFILANPATGNQSLAFSSTAGFSFSNSILCEFTGVDTGTPAQHGTGSPSLSVNVTSATGDIVVATEATTNSFSALSGTQIYLNNTNASAANYDNGAASVTISATGTGAPSIAAFDLKAASGGGGCTVHRMGLLGAGC